MSDEVDMALARFLFWMLIASMPSQVGQGWLGVMLDERHKAAVVAEVIPGSPAEYAGLRPGDRLASDLGDFVSWIEHRRPAEVVQIVVWRDGHPLHRTVRMGRHPKAAPQVP